MNQYEYYIQAVFCNCVRNCTSDVSHNFISKHTTHIWQYDMLIYIESLLV